MSRTILLEKHAIKFLEKLDKDTACRIIEKLERLENDSIPPDARKLVSLKQSSYRILVGDYRILYRIEKDSIVVFSINKRSVAYKR